MLFVDPSNSNVADEYYPKTALEDAGWQSVAIQGRLPT